MFAHLLGRFAANANDSSRHVAIDGEELKVRFEHRCAVMIITRLIFGSRAAPRLKVHHDGCRVHSPDEECA